MASAGEDPLTDPAVGANDPGGTRYDSPLIPRSTETQSTVTSPSHSRIAVRCAAGLRMNSGCKILFMDSLSPTTDKRNIG
jgi:hypothetical protein